MDGRKLNGRTGGTREVTDNTDHNSDAVRMLLYFAGLYIYRDIWSAR